MATFSTISLDKLNTCHPNLQRLFKEVVKHWDCTVICGHRGEAEQNKAFAEGKSQLKYPQGKHNKTPSLAVDVMPYPIDWNDTTRICAFAGFVLGVAKVMGIDVRWGGDWNQNRMLKDETFSDKPHFELMGF